MRIQRFYRVTSPSVMAKIKIIKSDRYFDGDQDNHGQFQPQAPLGVDQIRQRARCVLDRLYLVRERGCAFLQFT